jgi:predicted nucleic acid-binding protein
MSSLSFPDINLWLAIASHEHIHASVAKDWWQQEEGAIAFCRLTQLGFLRLMTTAAVMDVKPLTVAEAWRVYDRLYDDDRDICRRTSRRGPAISGQRRRANCIAQSVGRCLVARFCARSGGYLGEF